MSEWNQLVNSESIAKTAAALEANGFKVIIVENKKEGREAILKLIPENSEVMTMSSVTLHELDLDEELNESGNYKSVRAKFKTMDPEKDRHEMNRLGSSPEIAVGSVNAISQDGRVLIASATGSQLAAYVYGADKVIWVAGTQKITDSLESAKSRVYDYVLPLESERALKAYGRKSSINKLLEVNKEVVPGRITIVLIKEKLGF